MRHPGRAATLIAVALAVTACGTGSYFHRLGRGRLRQLRRRRQPGHATSASGAPAPTATLKTEAIGAGKVLASSGGLTLYYYAEDKPGSGKSACTGGCAGRRWPPLAAPVRAPVGVRLPGPLGMITRPGGGAQITINGYPVYTFSGDKSPGQAAGNGIEGAWHVIKIRVTAAALTVTHTSAGKVLASSRGLTLYYYAEDKPGSGKSACTGSCAAAWPPLAAPVQGSGGRAPARPARDDHPARRCPPGHH